MPQDPHVILCRCAHAEVLAQQTVESVRQGLSDAGMACTIVDDLCGLAARRDPVLQEWAATPLTIMACYPRAIRWLFHRGEAPLPNDSTVVFKNLREEKAESILASIASLKAPLDDCSKPAQVETADQWIPWFPVIDYERCQNCKLCLNFCLFGVYELTDDQVTVKRPQHCKTNCPACARLCPAHAIIFPKYAEVPVNGDDVPEESAPTDAQPACVNALLEGNIYDLLRKRNPARTRFSTEPQSQIPLLQDLHNQLDIPMEVLQSLSPADLTRIQKKAAKPAPGDPPDV